MKVIKIILSLLLTFFLISFIIPQKNTQQQIVITDKDVAWADGVWKSTTLSDLNNGYGIFTKSCNKCHKYVNPEKRKREKWEKIIPKMAIKAKLSQVDELLLLKFVITEGRKYSN